MKTTKPKQESGSSMLVVLTIMVVLMVAVVTAGEYTRTISRHVQRSVNQQTAIAIGDGCLESAFSYWRELCRYQTTAVIPNSWTALIPLPLASHFPNVPNFTATTAAWTPSTTATVSNFSVIAADAELNPLPSSTATPVPSIGMANNGAVDLKTTHAVWSWIASAYVTLPSLNGTTVAKVQRIFQKEQISPWNYAIFYVDPLEIHPGPDFNITGPVSTNTELYTAHSTLHFLDKATYGTDWSIGYHPLDPRPNNPPPTSPTWPAALPPAREIAHQPFGLDSTRIFNTTDTNPNNDGYHELVEPPIAGSPDPLVGQRYYDQAGTDSSGKAGVQIIVNASNVVSYARANGDGTATPLTSSSRGSDKKLYDMVSQSGVVTVKNGSNDIFIQDAREGGQVRIATIDLSMLRKSGNDQWDANEFNGILYLLDTSGSSTVKRGFRLKNGAFIPPGGLTVASPNPIYVQGDFNTGTAPLSNLGDPTKPEGDQTGIGQPGQPYQRQPCAIIADAVSILSNAFNDTKLTASLSGRIATNTTVNTAIVSGIVPTSAASYSGGAENFPRFLEDWGNAVTLTYYGSMVELYQSLQSTGTWSNASYVPPVRQWYFDTNFQFSCPPGSLMIYSYVKGRWSLQ